MESTRKYIAEFIATFWLVFAGCGSALLAAGFQRLVRFWLEDFMSKISFRIGLLNLPAEL